jgi:hypothetical protein
MMMECCQMSNKKLSISKQVVSMTEISQMLQMSRARFYQLLDIGFFPKPLHDERSKRPYYDLALQQKCLECRQSGIGVDGSFMLFYSCRKKETVTNMKKKKVDPVVKELTETLETMGLDITVEQVQQGLGELYPDGTENQEQGVVVRELFRKFKG